MSLILSIQIGKAKNYETGGHSWRTATFKEPLEGVVWLGREGFTGDQQADRRYHGGPEKAALVYSGDHYTPWQEEIFPLPLPPGAFGENILVQGMSEKDVCVGDIYALGEALVQVSQPRRPCGKQAHRWGIAGLVDLMNKSGRTGWYLRVLREGHVKAGDYFDLRDRPHPEWTVPKAHRIMNFEKDPDAALALAACPALAAEWQQRLLDRASKP